MTPAPITAQQHAGTITRIRISVIAINVYVIRRHYRAVLVVRHIVANPEQHKAVFCEDLSMIYRPPLALVVLGSESGSGFDQLEVFIEVRCSLIDSESDITTVTVCENETEFPVHLCQINASSSLEPDVVSVSVKWNNIWHPLQESISRSSRVEPTLPSFASMSID